MGEKIKHRRKELHLTMLDIAKKTGVSEATVSRWESGDIANMRRDKIATLATALQVSPAYLMGWEDTPESFENLDQEEADLIENFKKLDNDDKEKVVEYTKALQQKMPVLIIENEPRYLVRRAGRDGSFSEEYLTKEEIEKIKEEANALEEADF